MLRRMIRPSGFKTFVINYLNYPSKTAYQKVYGFNVEQCKGPFVMDGLDYISSNLDQSLIVPYSMNSDFYMMNINGENNNALTTKMEDTNVIYPIIGSPTFSMFMTADNPEYHVDFVDNFVRYQRIAA